MLDVGWQELFVIAVITIIVVGPKEIPRVLRTVTHWIRKIKDMAREFHNSIDDLAREAELDDIKKELAAAKDFDIEREFENAIDPTGEIENAIHDLEDTGLEDTGDETEPLLENTVAAPDDDAEKPASDDDVAKISGA